MSTKMAAVRCYKYKCSLMFFKQPNESDVQFCLLFLMKTNFNILLINHVRCFIIDLDSTSAAAHKT